MRHQIDRELYVWFWLYYSPDWQPVITNHIIMRITNSLFHTTHENIDELAFAPGAIHF